MEPALTKRNLLLLLTGVFLLHAWVRAINLLYVLFSLLSAILILAHLLPRYSLRGIVLKRFLPSKAFEGDEIEIKVDIRNSRLTSRYMIEILDFMPAAKPGLQNPMTFIARLPGRRQREYSYKMACYLRGEHQTGPVTIRSAYPLGICSSEKMLPDTVQTLLVYPQVFQVSAFPLPAGHGAGSGGTEVFSKEGGSDEFFGTREYRDGDSLKTIHWPSTARHGQLIVKQFEMRAYSEATIIMDLCRDSVFGAGKESTIEYAVKIAASLSRHILGRGHSLQFIGYGERPHVVAYDRGMTQNARILEVLARVKAEGDLPYQKVICRSNELLRDGSTVILLFSTTPPSIDDYLYGLSLLKARRMNAVAVFIDEASFENDKPIFRIRENPLVRWFVNDGVQPYFVSKGANLEAVFSS